MNPVDEPTDVQSSARLGACLGDLRRQLHLSLQEVEVGGGRLEPRVQGLGSRRL